MGFCCVFFFVWVFCILYFESLWRAFGAVCVWGPWVGRGVAGARGGVPGGGAAVARGGVGGLGGEVLLSSPSCGGLLGAFWGIV